VTNQSLEYFYESVSGIKNSFVSFKEFFKERFLFLQTNESDYPEIRAMVKSRVLLPVSSQLDANSSLACTEGK
jgi:hypothetical protein